MRSRSKPLLQIGMAAIAALSFAGVTPHEGQLIELKNFVNARSESKFRPTDDNKIYELHKGTKAIIGEKPVEFKDPKTKKPYAYGLCLKILNAEVSTKKDCYWVYYRESAKNLEIHDVTGEQKNKLLAEWKTESSKKVGLKVLNEKFTTKLTSSPKENLPVHVVQDTASIHEPHYPPAPKTKTNSSSAPVERSGADNMNLAVITKATEINTRLNTNAMKPEPPKNGCDGKCSTPPLGKGEMCSPGKNDYLEKDMEQLRKDPQTVISQLLSISTPEKYVKDECFATALQFKGGSYKTCGDNQPMQKVERPCASDNLRRVVRNSFDMTMDCLGEFLTNNSKTVPAAAQNFFNLIAHESGHNPNAVSWSGAGGSTQLTDPIDPATNKASGAIAHFNRTEKEIMLNYLSKKNDPRCTPIQQVLKQGMAEGPSNSCDRIALNKGNPLLNLVYGLGYQKFLRRTVSKLIVDNPMAQRVFAKIEPQAREFLENQLSLWGHNTGPSGMTGAIIRFLAKNPNLSVVTVSDATNMLSAMKSSIKAEGRSVAEPTNYLAAVNKRAEFIQNSTGAGTCAVK